MSTSIIEKALEKTENIKRLEVISHHHDEYSIAIRVLNEIERLYKKNGFVYDASTIDSFKQTIRGKMAMHEKEALRCIFKEPFQLTDANDLPF